MPYQRSGLKKRGIRIRASAFSGIPGLRAETLNTAVVYPEHALIYNRIKKSGNSSVLFYLRELLYGDQGALQSSYDDDKRAAVATGRKLSALSLRQLVRARHYFRFTIFRNPHARCLSMFFSKGAKREAGSVKYRTVPGFDKQSPEGFAEFVGFLEQDGLYYDKHFWPQCDLLMCPPEHFDHIGQLENLREELKHVAAQVGLVFRDSIVSNEPHAADQSNEGKVTGASTRLDEYYTDELYHRVHQLYRHDFDAGRYPQHPHQESNS